MPEDEPRKVGLLYRDLGVADVSVGDGQRGNALSSEDWRELEQTFRHLAEDDQLRAVVVRGQGGTFSAGSDMREWVQADRTDVAQSFAAMEAAFTAIEDLPVPVIAEVEGVAAGAGCQLALACDLRVLADTARIGMPIARLGILVSPSFAARLSVLAGPGVARELLYTGRRRPRRRYASAWPRGASRSNTCPRPPTGWCCRSYAIRARRSAPPSTPSTCRSRRYAPRRRHRPRGRRSPTTTSSRGIMTFLNRNPERGPDEGLNPGGEPVPD